MLTIKERPATVYDFMKLKDYKPWKGWRRTAKTINFSLVFGCAPGRFGQTLRDKGFTEADCDELIQDAHLQESYRQYKEKKAGKLDELGIKYITCAQFMRDGFFSGYKGLEDRITREQNYGVAHGFVRAWHGPFRHIPALKLMHFSSNGMPDGADNKFWSKYASEQKNIACNSTIQTMEVRIAFPSIHWLCQTVKKWGLKSYMWNMTHDSQDWVIYDKEEELIKALVKYCCTYEREPVYGIHMGVDCEVSDLSTPENREKMMYHHGEGAKIGDIHEELAKYNKLMGTNLELPPLDL